MRSSMGVSAFAVALVFGVFALVGCGGGGSSQTPFNGTPAIASISPSSATAGSSALTITVSGWNFTPSSVVCWNQSAPLELPTAYVNSTTLTAQVSAADLQNAGHAAVQVMEPSGSTTSGMLFTIGLAPVPGLTVVNTIANDLVWDPVYQKIYLSLPSSDGVNGNTVQVLDPLTGTLGASAFAGSEPNLLAVSNTSKYLYVSLNGAPNVQRMTLPNFGTDISIPLGSNQLYGPFYALDLEAAPNSDNTVAVVRELPGLSPEGSAGVVIYDDRTARSNILCGPGQAQSNSCANITWTGPYDFIQWSADGCTMFATNDETTGADFYTIPVTTSGFGTGTDYKGVTGFGKLHYDTVTGYVYFDGGTVIDPNGGTIVGTFTTSGLTFPIMVPDGSLGRVFFLGQSQADIDNFGNSAYTLQSLDINKFTPIATLTIPNVIGYPTHLIRWGTNGLAFTTITSPGSPQPSGAVYIIGSPFVNGN